MPEATPAGSTNPVPQPHAPHPSQASALRRWAGPLGAIVLLLASCAGMSVVGLPVDTPVAALASTLTMVSLGGGLALGYLLGAMGWGRLVVRVLAKDSPSAVWLQLPCGLGLALFASHMLGVLGLLSGPGGIIGAWAFVGVGLVVLAHQVTSGELRPERWPVAPVWLWLGAPALGLTLVAASSPPGWLWGSEGGGYDVLSYHMQLVKEWLSGSEGLLGAGRLWPVEHNVYSYLPSYMEGAFLHVAAMVGAGSAPDALVAGDGLGVVGAQMLHTLVGLVGALTVARCVWVALDRASVPGWCARFGACCGAAMVLGTPWSVVVGSMAYNEMVLVTLGAGAVLVSLDGGSSALKRAIVAGALVGVAAGAKPTGVFLLGPVAGLALLAYAPKRKWVPMVLVGSVAGVAVMAPWLVRNFLAGGNPIFPFGTDLFGSAHWSAEQVARYGAAHRFDGTLMDRIGLLFSSDRGIMHAQWVFVFPMSAVCLVIACVWRQTRTLGVVLVLGALGGLAAWLALTHVQSRFLVPLVVPLATGFGLACGWLAHAGHEEGRPGPRGVAGAGLGVVICLALAAASGWIFTQERSGMPNAFLVGGVGDRTGWYVAGSSAQERASVLEEVPVGPTEFFNVVPGLDPDAKLLLVGDATPLYYLGDPSRVVYHTTYDRSVLGDAIRANPGDPDAWSEALRAQGIGYVLINWSELGRLWSSGSGPTGWYDPDVTPEAIESWARSLLHINAWPAPDGFGVAQLLAAVPDQRTPSPEGAEPRGAQP